MAFKPVPFLWAVGAAGIGLFAASRVLVTSRSKEVESTAPLLQQVQALGELHAVKYTYRDVHQFSTQEEPADWFSVVPGATDLVHAATVNTTLMSYTGTVEAGVDLAKAKIHRTPVGIQILLPQPRVYAANVKAQVNDLHRGLMWHDISIATSAIEDAKRRFQETSLRQGIVDEARKNARERVLQLSQALARVPVTVNFA